MNSHKKNLKPKKMFPGVKKISFLLFCFFAVNNYLFGQSAGSIHFGNNWTKWIAFPDQKIGAMSLTPGHHNGNCPSSIAEQAFRVSIDNGTIEFVENFGYKLAVLGCLTMDNTHLSNICGYPMLNIINDYVGKDVKIIRSQKLGVSDGLWGCKKDPLVFNTLPLSVIVLPKITPESQNITYGQSTLATTIELPGINNNTAYEYQWQYSFDFNSWFNFGDITKSTVNTVINTTSNYSVRCAVKLKETGQISYSNKVSVNVTIPTLNPGTIASNQTICYNTSLGLFFTQSPSGGIKTYFYQWQISLNKELWSDLFGAVSSGYNTGNLAQTRYYRCRVTSGAQSYTTNELTITVNPELTAGVISQNQTICYNTGTTIISLTPPSGGIGSITYSWQKYQSGSWVNISGATGLTYTTGNLIATTQLRRVAANSCGSVTVQTTVSVQGQLVAGQIGGTTTICYNSGTTLTNVTSATGGIGTITYQWQKYQNSSWVDISAATGLIYAAQNLTATTKFRRQATNSCASVQTNEITIVVNPELLPGQISQNQTICYNTSTAILSLTGASGSGTITYEWQKYQNGSWMNISGAAGLNYTTGNLTSTTLFRRQATNSCASVQTNEITITVNPELLAGQISQNQTICKNTAAEILTNEIAASGGIGSITYQWQKSSDGYLWNSIQNETNEYYNPLTIAQTTYYRRLATNSCGTVVTNPISIIVNPQPDFTLANQNICKGNNTVINAPGGFHSYKWNTGETLSTISVNPQQTTIYTVTVTNEYGCSSSKTMTLTVYPLPEIALENKEACEGVNTVIGAPAGFSSYLWSNGQTSQAISITPFATTNYTLYVTNAYGCQSNATMILTVNPKPNVSLQSMAACKGDLAAFVAEPAGYKNYLWSYGNSAINTMQLIADNSRNISVTVTDSKGCTNGANAFLTVNPKPEITLSDQEACYGDNVMISAPSGYSYYAWNNGQGNTNVISIKAYESTNYSVTVKNSYECSQSASMKLTVNQLPELNMPGIEGCFGTNVLVSAPMGYTDYLWSNGTAQRSFNTVANENQTYTVTVKNIKSCSNSAEVKLKVNPLPIINLSDAYINQGENYTIAAPGGYREYYWSNGNSGTNTITVSPRQTTIYSISVNDDNNCTNNDKMTLTVYDLPSIKLNDSVICAGESMEIKAPEGFKTYRWNNGTIGTNKITVSPAATTEYSVEVTNETGGAGIGSMILTVYPLPVIGCRDTLICKGNPVTLPCRVTLITTGIQENCQVVLVLTLKVAKIIWLLLLMKKVAQTINQ